MKDLLMTMTPAVKMILVRALEVKVNQLIPSQVHLRISRILKPKPSKFSAPMKRKTTKLKRRWKRRRKMSRVKTMKSLSGRSSTRRQSLHSLWAAEPSYLNGSLLYVATHCQQHS